MAVTQRLRFEILRRDNHACRYCGATAPEATLTVDHVVPVALGGADDPSNLVAACRSCNGGKTSSNPDANVVEDVRQDALRWRAAMQEAARLAVQEQEVMANVVEQFDDAWHHYHNEYTPTRVPPWRPATWVSTVENWTRDGLRLELLVGCIEIAMRHKEVGYSDKWRYLCGIVRRRLMELHDTARELANDT